MNKVLAIVFLMLLSCYQSFSGEIPPEQTSRLERLRCYLNITGRRATGTKLPMVKQKAEQKGVTLKVDLLYNPGCASIEPDSCYVKNLDAHVFATETEAGIVLSGNIVDDENPTEAHGHGFLFSGNKFFEFGFVELSIKKENVEIFRIDCSLRKDQPPVF